MTENITEKSFKQVLELLQDKCPRLFKSCYWAGTSAIASEETHHRISYDLDFHTISALQDVRPLLAELQNAFPGKVKVLKKPDQLGSGFRAVLSCPEGDFILEVLSNFETISDTELTISKLAPRLKRVSLQKYLADKIQCIAERAEARDLIDVHAVLTFRPELKALTKELIKKQDLIVLTERLIAWSNEDLKADLSAYPDVRFEDATFIRTQLLDWIKEIRNV